MRVVEDEGHLNSGTTQENERMKNQPNELTKGGSKNQCHRKVCKSGGGRTRLEHSKLRDRSCRTGLNLDLYFYTFYLPGTGYQFSYDKVSGHKFGVKIS